MSGIKFLSKALFVDGGGNKTKLGGLFLNLSVMLIFSARMSLVQQEKELTENILSVV